MEAAAQTGHVILHMPPQPRSVAPAPPAVVQWPGLRTMGCWTYASCTTGLGLIIVGGALLSTDAHARLLQPSTYGQQGLAGGVLVGLGVLIDGLTALTALCYTRHRD